MLNPIKSHASETSKMRARRRQKNWMNTSIFSCITTANEDLIT